MSSHLLALLHFVPPDLFLYVKRITRDHVITGQEHQGLLLSHRNLAVEDNLP